METWGICRQRKYDVACREGERLKAELERSGTERDGLKRNKDELTAKLDRLNR